MTKRSGKKIFTRQELIKEEIDNIKKDTKTFGATPTQTLSRILQDLRNEGIIHFSDDYRGTYVLLDTPINIDSEQLNESTLEYALKKNKIRFGDIPTENKEIISRYRKGQALLRKLTLENYDYKCGFCDVTDDNLLVASHISRWADDPDGRGDLSNIICLYRII